MSRSELSQPARPAAAIRDVSSWADDDEDEPASGGISSV